MSVLVVFCPANKTVHAPAKLVTRKHDNATTAEAPEAYVCANSGDFPVDPTTGMGLAKRDDVTCLYAVCVLASRVSHFLPGWPPVTIDIVAQRQGRSPRGLCEIGP